MSVTSTDQTNPEPVGQTADIIPFRQRTPTAALAPAVASSTAPAAAHMTLAQQRLARALETLNAAMIDQRTAMAAWRASLSDLKSSTTGLGDSLDRYRTNLASLSQGVTALRTQARTLRDWADKTATE